MSRVHYLAIGVGICLSLWGLLWYWLDQRIHQPLLINNQVFTIQPGTSVVGLAQQLHAKGIVDWLPTVRLTYWVHAAMRGGAVIQAGDYQLTPSDTVYSVLGKFIDGEVIGKVFTIIPGWNKKQLMEALIAAHIICDTTQPLNASKRLAMEQQLIKNLAIPHTSIEGMFLADSYHYIKNCDLAVLRLAYNALQQTLDSLWDTRDTILPYANAYDALKLASIVEKETGIASERAIVASVFINRLRKKMRLQTDPTVIYGLGDSYDGNITARHLRRKTPYNTYVVSGLPPTPISMVSKAALTSAFMPQTTRYLYFVGKGDGSHEFSTTYEAHKRAVNRYQVYQRNKQYRSTP